MDKHMQIKMWKRDTGWSSTWNQIKQKVSENHFSLVVWITALQWPIIPTNADPNQPEYKCDWELLTNYDPTTLSQIYTAGSSSVQYKKFVDLAIIYAWICRWQALVAENSKILKGSGRYFRNLGSVIDRNLT
jgi:hypothetical protein